MTSIEWKHVVFHGMTAWGHFKPLLPLAVLMLKSHPDIILTILTENSIHAKLTREMSSKLEPDQYEAIAQRINIISVCDNLANLFDHLPGFDEAFKALYNSQTVTCKATGKTFSAMPRPRLAIVDPFTGNAIEVIRAISKGTIPIIAWMTSNAAAVLSMFGPHYLDGASHPSLETKTGIAEAKQALRPEETSSVRYDGTVRRIPGMPPMYDYEFNPAEFHVPGNTLEQQGQIYLRDTDATLVISSSVFEKETMDAAKQWYKSMGKSLYAVGPLSLPDLPTTKKSNPTILSFLDGMMERFGARSLIYISFGTIFWPTQPDKLWALIEELISSHTPFIFTHPSMFSHVPDEQKKLIAESGIGLELEWCPQEIILEHPVTGWFLSHGGWNSTQEAFVSRVPLIFWPFRADQPLNAAHLVLHHQAAFELIEVRNAERGTRKPYRCKDGPSPEFTVAAVREEVRLMLTRIRGDEGRSVREKFERLCDGMERAWDEGHESRRDLEEFLQTYLG